MEFHIDTSFRGRKNLGYAHWTKKGRKNVITHYLNIQGKWAERMDYWNKKTNDIMAEPIILMFMGIDFHELLHLLIRRESGLKGTYHVTEECEEFIKNAEEELLLLLGETYLYEEPIYRCEYCGEPLEDLKALFIHQDESSDCKEKFLSELAKISFEIFDKLDKDMTAEEMIEALSNETEEILTRKAIVKGE